MVRTIGLDADRQSGSDRGGPLDVGKSTFTPLLTKVDKITKKMSSKNTRSVIEDMFPVTLTLLRWPRFIRVQVLREYQ